MAAIIPPDAHLALEAEDPALIRAKITAETARINWIDLQKFYAAGSVITVDNSIDLIDVAFAFSRDDQAQVAQWLAESLVERTTEAQAQHWYSTQTELWAVVISPWVLVQDKPLASALN